jgi:hypothetical protein
MTQRWHTFPAPTRMSGFEEQRLMLPEFGRLGQLPVRGLEIVGATLEHRTRRRRCRRDIGGTDRGLAWVRRSACADEEFLAVCGRARIGSPGNRGRHSSFGELHRHASDEQAELEKVLRQGLGYCWNVAVSSDPVPNTVIPDATTRLAARAFDSASAYVRLCTMVP